jgi:hypothetical protein
VVVKIVPSKQKLKRPVNLSQKIANIKYHKNLFSTSQVIASVQPGGTILPGAPQGCEAV